MGLRIGALTLDNPLVLAPMAGVTDLPFRRICRQMGAALVGSEMVSALGLVRGAPNSRRLLTSDGSDRPLSVQIFGTDAAIMARAARICQEEGADVLDVNMGCPVAKVVRRGAGAALLRDLPHAARVLDAIRRAIQIPLTVKLRAGWTAQDFVAPELARIARECGVDAIAFHPRSRSQGYGIPARWDLIRQLRESTSLPVIGNGDVLQPCDALAMRQATGCHGIMIGRGARGNPWIFPQALALLGGQTPQALPGVHETWRIVCEHLQGIQNHYPSNKALHLAKAHLLRYLRGFPGSARIRETASRSQDLDALVEITEGFFSSGAAHGREEILLAAE
jgi:tRNA-dihydrouridine synthase B